VPGLSNQTDKIVVRSALTIYPYSLGIALKQHDDIDPIADWAEMIFIRVTVITTRYGDRGTGFAYINGVTRTIYFDANYLLALNRK
jgi:hypothetical protein